jgi:hypothetical protein
MTSRRRIGPADRGGGGIEMAIIFPLLLSLVFGVSHLSLHYLAQQAALSVAQVAVEGERSWLAEPGAGRQRAEQFHARLPGVLQDVRIQVSNDGQHVTATVTGEPIQVIPWWTTSVSQTASGPVERLT